MELVFGKANAKLKALEKIYGKLSTFSVLSGHTCPYAKECHSQVDLQANGHRKIKDGPHTKFRCFSASQEVQYTNVYNSRKNNGAVIELAAIDYKQAAKELRKAIPKNTKIVSIHVGGDFKTQAYFDAWVTVASEYQDITFYAYTKSIKYWTDSQIYDWCTLGNTDNFKLIASVGGKHDDLIEKHSLYIRSARVVHSIEQAQQLNLEIDYDEQLAITSDKDFALLIHGTQPKPIYR